MEANLINLDYLKSKLNIEFKDDIAFGLNQLETGDCSSDVIPFIIDGFQSETRLSYIYNHKQIVKYTNKFNKFMKKEGYNTLNPSQIVFAADVGDSPIILDTFYGNIFLYWHDFNGELALLSDNFVSFIQLIKSEFILDSISTVDYSYFTEDAINKIFSDLKLELSASLLSSFKRMPYGKVNARSFEFLYNNLNYSAIIEEILNPEEIVRVTNEYRFKSLINNHTMVIAVDPAGFYICFSLKSLEVFILYEKPIPLIKSIDKLIDTIYF